MSVAAAAMSVLLLFLSFALTLAQTSSGDGIASPFFEADPLLFVACQAPPNGFLGVPCELGGNQCGGTCSCACNPDTLTCVQNLCVVGCTGPLDTSCPESISVQGGGCTDSACMRYSGCQPHGNSHCCEWWNDTTSCLPSPTPSITPSPSAGVVPTCPNVGLACTPGATDGVCNNGIASQSCACACSPLTNTCVQNLLSFDCCNIGSCGGCDAAPSGASAFCDTKSCCQYAYITPQTPSSTRTPSPTGMSVTPTRSVSNSRTPSGTPTNSPTPTMTGTHVTQSRTGSLGTRSNTPSASQTPPAQSFSSTPTSSITIGASGSNTPSTSSSSTISASASASSTHPPSTNVGGGGASGGGGGGGSGGIHINITIDSTAPTETNTDTADDSLAATWLVIAVLFGLSMIVVLGTLWYWLAFGRARGVRRTPKPKRSVHIRSAGY